MDREQSILEAAAILPPLERCGFLEVVCAGQPELRTRIESRLRSDGMDTIRVVAGSRQETAAAEMIAIQARRMR